MDYYVGLISSYGIVGWVIIILIVIIVVVLIASLLSGSGRSRRGYGRDTAEDIIKTRYAKGEIDKREFDEKRKDLRR